MLNINIENKTVALEQKRVNARVSVHKFMSFRDNR